MKQNPYRRVTCNPNPDGTPCVTLEVMTHVDPMARHADMVSVRDPSKRNKNWKMPTDEGDWKPYWKPRRKPLKAERVALREATKKFIKEKTERELERRIAMSSDMIKYDAKGVVVWTPELKEALLEHISDGGTIKAFADRVGVSRYRVDMLLRTEEMRPLAEQAKRKGADALMEEALEFATNPLMMETRIERYAPASGGNYYEDMTLDDAVKLQERMVKSEDNVNARKLAYQARVHLASKIAPDKYGEKPEVKESDTMAERIIKARQRLQGAS